METIRISAPWEDATSVFVDDHDFIISYEIVDITIVYCSCFQSIFDMMEIIEVLTDIDIFYSEIVLELGDAILSECSCFLFLVDLVISLCLE